jgi:hypothetical protein
VPARALAGLVRFRFRFVLLQFFVGFRFVFFRFAFFFA